MYALNEKLIVNNLGPLVQSIVSSTNSFEGQLVMCFTVLLPNTLIFFAKKMKEASRTFSVKILL